VELAALADPALVPQTAAAALGVREEPGRAAADTLVRWLEERRALLVLDNCEHVVGACARLAEALLGACPGLRVLATSREALGLGGEAVRPVAALQVPATAAAAGEALVSEAARLFVDRAALAKAGFTASEGSAEAIAAVCRRLEGIPLAIELAAARVKVLTVEQILARLVDRLRLLSGGGRAAPSRQQTLRATLDWSYDLLTGQERTLLRRLSVFSGGWRLEAAEAVGAGGGIEAQEVLDLLSRLADKSLLLVHDQDQAVRYAMLETIGEYARERLGESGEAGEVARRHAEYFLAFGEEAKPQLGGSRAAEWYKLLEAEHDNLRAALGWLLEHDAEACLRMAMAVPLFWEMRGHYAEGQRWLAAALKQAATAPAVLRAQALNAVGHLAWRQGDTAARAYLEESLRIAREAGDVTQAVRTSHNLGLVALHQGELHTARGLFEEALAGATEMGYVRRVAESLIALGELARLEGEWAAARSLYERALKLFRGAGYQVAVTVALGNLGAVAAEEGDLRAARSYYREALAIDRAMGSREGIACALDGVADVASRTGEWTRAGRLAGAAEALRRGIGYELEPADRAFRERYMAEAREHLGEAGLEAALAEGRAMTIEQAVRMELEEDQG
jgi:non-specific serine/threonine protein kinase